MPTTRRQFAKNLLAGGTAMTLTNVASSRVLGANDEIRVGVVGTGGRGSHTHIPELEAVPGVSVVAVCDADRSRLGKAAEMIDSKYRRKVDQYVDMRKMFERQDIDVISNATQVYWHALSTVWACQAGKHVYVEKPLSHYIWEGRQMVAAARKHDRIIQVGSQRRSQRCTRAAIEWTRQGHLGRIRYVTVFISKPRRPCGQRDTPLPIPEAIDYDLWCGPARKEPIYRDRLQYDCRYDLNTSAGEPVDQGTHDVDVARWWLGETDLPHRVMSIGGRFLFKDAGNVPNSQIVCFEYPTAPIVCEVHNLGNSKGSLEPSRFRGLRIGVCVHLEGGYVVNGLVGPRGCPWEAMAYDNDGQKIKDFPTGPNGTSEHDGTRDHFANFFQAIRDGRRDDLRAEAEVGHISAATCLAGSISHRVGRMADETEQRAQVEEVPAFTETHERFLRHLKANEIDPATATLGPWLEIDRENECVREHDQANEIVRGYYREPYVVPDLTT